MSTTNGNGGKPGLAVNPRQEIPIIGQPFRVLGWFPTVMVLHNCGTKEPMMLPKGAAAQCPGCKRMVALHVMQLPPGQVNFGFALLGEEPSIEDDAAEGVQP
jgi:hypothetical protein